MSGAFAEWQPRYAAHGVATFPVTADKIPAVKGYLRVGMKASEQLSMKFSGVDVFGLACKRNRITVLDVDTPDERVLADALSRHGPTPFIVRSGSGNFQAWFRNNGEKRRVRPDPEKPIDILGDGFVVAPPSLARKGRYEIIQGTLDDLDGLPKMRVNVGADFEPLTPPEAAPCREARSPPPQKNESRPFEGLRNNALFHRLLPAARKANSKEELMQFAAQANREFNTPLPNDEVLRAVSSVWGYREKGRLFTPGGQATAVVFQSDVEHLWDKPNALSLLIRLRMAHGWRNGEPFTLARETAQLIGVSYPTYRDARDVLVGRHFLEIVHAGGRGKEDPPLARLI